MIRCDIIHHKPIGKTNLANQLSEGTGAQLVQDFLFKDQPDTSWTSILQPTQIGKSLLV